MPRHRPDSKPLLPAWILPILTLGISVLVHSVWSLPDLELPTVMVSESAPPVAILQGKESAEWIPVMFSLPSPDGFSGVVRRLDTNLSPPLSSPLQLTGPASVDPLQEKPRASLSAFPLETTSLTVMGPHKKRPADSAKTQEGWRLWFPDRPDLRVVLIRDSRIQNPDSAVRLSGEMHFDRFGRLQNLFFEPHSLPAREMDLLLPDVRQIGISQREAPARFRFELTYTPDVP